MNDSFITEALNCHNMLRAKHGSPPLRLCQYLCQSSQKYAQKLLKLSTIKSSINQNLGENILSIKSKFKISKCLKTFKS